MATATGPELRRNPGCRRARPKEPGRPRSSDSGGLHARRASMGMRGCKVGGDLFPASEVHLLHCPFPSVVGSSLPTHPPKKGATALNMSLAPLLRGSPIAPLNSRFRFVRQAPSDAKLFENAGPEQDRSRGRTDPSSYASAFDVDLPPERLHLLASGRSVFQREPVLHRSKARIHNVSVDQLLSLKSAAHPGIGVLRIPPPAGEHSPEEPVDTGAVPLVVATKCPIKKQLGFIP